MPRKDLVSYKAKRRYSMRPGWLMWKAHRWSGVCLGLFLVLHIFLMAGKLEFLSFIKAPSHIAGVAAIFVLHTINGFRIMFMEFGQSAERDKYKSHMLIAIAIMGVLLISFIIRGDYVSLLIEEYLPFLHKGA